MNRLACLGQAITLCRSLHARDAEANFALNLSFQGAWLGRQPNIRDPLPDWAGSLLLARPEWQLSALSTREPCSRPLNLLHWHIHMRHCIANTILCQLPVHPKKDSSC